MDLDGHVDGVADPDLDVRQAYRWQVLARTFDEKAVNLHRQGRIGTYAPLRGQEAAQVGAAMALADDDVAFPTYRDHALYMVRGVPPRDILLHLNGAGSNVDRQDADDLWTFPPTIPIATHLPHAVGAAMAADYRGDDRAAFVSFGDGATSEGDFHEALNFAGVFDAPAVFFCQNNGWAISVPVDRQTASDTIAQKADAYGFDGIQVDGNDVIAVYDAVTDALDRAQAGEGPTLIEAMTYRQGAHTTTDDPTRYRDEGEVEEWMDRDPLERTRQYLERHHDWTEEDETSLREWAADQVADALDAAERHDDHPVSEMFDHVYADEPASLAAQRDELVDEPDTDW
ncbi:pyruvate dehydrogenase (acetyl-transferring) E1 component subunit alpha [Halobacteriaceae archaeon GCM10025711]